ncbi:MAG: AAA family ATPase [Solirubrobacterales bacterium]|nr:AAA family ATPase [Solirubrobacterales bacterium]
MLGELEGHPHARAVLAPALAPGGSPSHAYLFYGPGGAGKRAAARAVAAEWLAAGSIDTGGARARVAAGTHPDLTWVSPSGAHEILVGDIDGPVVAAASRTPFEADRRVFVIERVDELGPQAANKMLKTLEEPPSYVHLMLLTERLAEVLPTIRSRCQLVRFDAPSEQQVAAELEALGAPEGTAVACARLSLGDAVRARGLVSDEGTELRGGAEDFARAALGGAVGQVRPWLRLLAAVRDRGEEVRIKVEAHVAAELELYPRNERRRVQTEWSERMRRARRRAETEALDLALALVSMWYADLLRLAWGAPDLIRHCDRRSELEADGGRSPQRLRAAVELVEDTRLRFKLNVSEELACEALAYRLEGELGW